MVDLFKTHGAVAFCILFAGLAAVTTSILSLMFATHRSGAKLGLSALGLVALTCTLAVVVVMRSRLHTDRAAMTLEEPVRSQRIEAGYARANGLAKMALVFGGSALMVGIVGTIRSLSSLKAREDEERGSARDPQLGELSDSMLGLGALVVGALAVFSVAAVGMPLLLKPPRSELAADDPAHGFTKAEQLLAEGKVGEACQSLEAAYAAAAEPTKARVRSVEGLVSECFDKKLESALSASSPEDFDRIAAELQATKMPLNEGQKKRLNEALELRKRAPN